MSFSKNLFLLVYTVFILSTPLPATTLYSQVVNWTGVILCNIPVIFSLMYNKSLPKAKQSILFNLNNFLMIQLHVVGIMTVIFATLVIYLPVVTEISASIYCILFTQTELFMSNVLVVTTQCIAIIIVTIGFNPEKYIQINSGSFYWKLKLGVLVASLVITCSVNLGCYSMCSGQLYFVGAIYNGIYNTEESTKFDFHCYGPIVVKIIFGVNALIYVGGMLIIPKLGLRFFTLKKENPVPALNAPVVEDPAPGNDTFINQILAEETPEDIHHQDLPETELLSANNEAEDDTSKDKLSPFLQAANRDANARFSQSLSTECHLVETAAKNKNYVPVSNQKIKFELRSSSIQRLAAVREAGNDDIEVIASDYITLESGKPLHLYEVELKRKKDNVRRKITRKQVNIIGFFTVFSVSLLSIVYYLIGIPWMRTEHANLLAYLFTMNSRFLSYIFPWIRFLNSDEEVKYLRFKVKKWIRHIFWKNIWPDALKNAVLTRLNSNTGY